MRTMGMQVAPTRQAVWAFPLLVVELVSAAAPASAPIPHRAQNGGVAARRKASNAFCSAGKYSNVSTPAQVRAMCLQTSRHRTAFEDHMCDGIDNMQEGCVPLRVLSQCPVGQLQGIAVLFHGFSACPHQFAREVEALTATCYHVFLPQSPGHGWRRCLYDNGWPCEHEPATIVNGWNVTNLPTSSAGYDQFTERMANIIKRELELLAECEHDANPKWRRQQLEVLSGGLSAGGPLSILFTQRMKGEVTREIHFSPFLGAADQSADDNLYSCIDGNQTQFDTCIDDFQEKYNTSSFVQVAEAFKWFPKSLSRRTAVRFYTSYALLTMLTYELMLENRAEMRAHIDGLEDQLMHGYGWGPGCMDAATNYSRAGFCDFRVEHLLAVNSMGMLSIRRSDSNMGADGETLDLAHKYQASLVERDGPTRNGLAVWYANTLESKHFFGSPGQMCEWRLDAKCSCKSLCDNNCGVPHSQADISDNRGITPFYMYWNQTLERGLQWFATNTSHAHTRVVSPAKFNLEAEKWDKGRDSCVTLDFRSWFFPNTYQADEPSMDERSMYEFLANHPNTTASIYAAAFGNKTASEIMWEILHPF